MGNVLKYLLLLLIILLTGVKYYQVKKDDTAMDVATRHITPFKPLLTVTSSIGFYCNAPQGPTRDIYSYALFALQPVVIKPVKADTLLLVLDKIRPAIIIKDYTTLARNSDGRFIYSLVKKNK